MLCQHQLAGFSRQGRCHTPALPEQGVSADSGVASAPPPVEQRRSAALARPRVAKGMKMIHPGIWPNTGHPYEQSVSGRFAYGAVPAACASRYTRSARGDIELLRTGLWRRTYYGATGWGGLDAGRATVKTGGGHPDAPARAPE